MPDSPNGQVIWTLESADFQKNEYDLFLVTMVQWTSYPGRKPAILSMKVFWINLEVTETLERQTVPPRDSGGMSHVIQSDWKLFPKPQAMKQSAWTII